MIISKIEGNKYRLETGLPWVYTDYVDIKDEKLVKQNPFGGGYYTALMFENLHPVDLIPILPKINREFLEYIKRKEKNISEEQKKHLEHILSFLYAPEYERAIKHYNDLLKKFGIVDEGKIISYVRIYATDNTQFQETLNTSLGENPIKSAISSVGDTIKNLPGGKVIDAYRQASKAIYLSPSEIEGLISSHGKGGIKDFVSLLADASARGLKIDFPKVWSSTDYSRTLNLSITLSSPYGHPKVLYKWVYAPLIALILLGAPLNIYGFTGMPLYLRVRAYGLSDIVLGAITSITFNRGGSNTVFNKYKQPLKFDLTITVTDLYSQFGIDYTYLKGKKYDTEEELTTPIDYHASPATRPPTSQPTLINFISSLKPFKDVSIETKVERITDKPVTKKQYSFRRKSNKK
jgi:hypothetical protein